MRGPIGNTVNASWIDIETENPSIFKCYTKNQMNMSSAELFKLNTSSSEFIKLLGMELLVE